VLRENYTSKLQAPRYSGPHFMLRENYTRKPRFRRYIAFLSITTGHERKSSLLLQIVICNVGPANKRLLSERKNIQCSDLLIVSGAVFYRLYADSRPHLTLNRAAIGTAKC
jgi:hypothetical protein